MNKDHLNAVFFAILALGLLTMMDVLIKIVGVRYPTFQLTFLRFVAGSLCALAVWLFLRPARPSAAAIKINILRGVMAAFSATTFFYALQMLPLAEAIAFSFLSPLFLAFFGFLLLGEAISRNTMLGLIFGFCGMLVMALGSGAGGHGVGGHALPLSGVLAATSSALSYALSLILLRQRAQQDAVATIVLFQNVVPGIILALPAMSVWVAPHRGDVPLFLAIGILGVAGHLCMAHAFRRAEASALAPTEYSALLFATLFGYLIFGDIPALATLLGASLIIIGTLLAVRRKS